MSNEIIQGVAKADPETLAATLNGSRKAARIIKALCKQVIKLEERVAEIEIGEEG